MSREIRQLKKSYKDLDNTEIFTYIRTIREKLQSKSNQTKINEFIETLYKILLHFSDKHDYNNERVIMNQIVELAWGNSESSSSILILAKSITAIILDSHSTRDSERINLFRDLIDILSRFPDSKIIYKAISTATIELIKWGTDSEILEILDLIQIKSANYPLIKSIQLLDAKVFMNTLFYLDEQPCDILIKIYQKFNSFAINCFEDENIVDCQPAGLIFGEDLNEILQEGAINAIINIARWMKLHDEESSVCLEGIRKIISESAYLLKKKSTTNLFKDIARLSYAFDQFNLWDKLLDIDIVQELKEERDKILQYKEAEAKFLAIQKTMRIEEYDSLKIGRRGLVLAYDLNEISDIKTILKKILTQTNNTFESINLVEEIDAVIEYNVKLKEHLRETGQIPADKISVDELQDKTSLKDDLTASATDESKIVKQLSFLKDLEAQESQSLQIEMLYTKALIFAVGMFGFESPQLQIKRLDLLPKIENLCENKMIFELINPLVRAVTLRAARLDGYAANILFNILNKKGLKFLNRFYKQYNFTDNLIRLISYLGRNAKLPLLLKIKNELEIANRLILNDDKIPIKIARAINEAILSFNSKNAERKLKLITLNKELAKTHSYNLELQIKYIDSLIFSILDINLFSKDIILSISNELFEFMRVYRSNEKIQERAVIGLLWLAGIFRIFDEDKMIHNITDLLNTITNQFPENKFIKNINNLYAESIITNE